MKDRGAAGDFPGGRGDILIEGVRHLGREVTVFVDGDGRIASLGKEAPKGARRDVATRIDGKGLALIPGLV
ncbi:MAG TPA: hypothetical protein VEI51_02420, partial [Methanomicrobiales archaeon]|nr:hypothetical protein [Methanomicrobiales archaeon]